MIFWFVFTGQSSRQHHRNLLTNSTRKKIQNGDIILRYGYGYVSDGIVRRLKEKYTVSHCGIIRKINDSIQIIHSDSNSDENKEGTHILSLDEFTNDSKPNSIIIVRLKNIDSLSQQKIVEIALNYARKHTAFDYLFNTSDDDKLFCTELVWRSYLKATGRNIFLNDKHNTDLLQFKSLYRPGNFDIIYNEQNVKQVSQYK